jgi:hypothetical protein
MKRCITIAVFRGINTSGNVLVEIEVPQIQVSVREDKVF